MKISASILYFLLICLIEFPASDALAGVTYKKYRDDKIQLEYLPTWRVSLKDSFITFKNRKGTEVLWVQVVSGTLDQAAEEAGFVRVQNKWRLLGRHDIEGDAEGISTKYWHGLVGEAPVGVSGDFGFGLGFATVAVISDGSTAAILSGEAMGSEEGDKILRSVRFRRSNGGGQHRCRHR